MIEPPLRPSADSGFPTASDSAQRYVNAAREVLAESGYQGITMRAVAVAAGTTATAIYSHFRDKDALMGVVHRQVHQEFKAVLGDASEGSIRTPRDRLLAGLRAYRDFGVDQPSEFAFLFLERHGIRSSRYPEDFKQRRASTFRVLVETVEACMAHGVLPADDPVEREARIVESSELSEPLTGPPADWMTHRWGRVR